tara:strand:- start:970 stop:1947 length:978 start_codon:yes stop_codon:yes gene_type:complete
MIFKVFELNKVDLSKFNFFLLYGKNIGLQNEIIEKYFTYGFDGIISRYEENEFIDEFDRIHSEILNKSLFESKKIILISRATDKIVKFVSQIFEREIKDVKIIIKSGILEKKSKLRNLFEKDKKIVTIPFYEDNTSSLSSVVLEFISRHKIKISRESINLIISRSSGDRQNLNIELQKILNYSESNKNIDYKIIQKITNLAENFNVNELAENFLSKDKKNISKILNENNYTNEDCILVIRSILIKSKRLLAILEKYEKNKNLDAIISAIRPPIFWKEKDGVKRQVNTWKLIDLKDKIYEINDLEMLIKNNTKNSLNILSDFIINC